MCLAVDVREEYSVMFPAASNVTLLLALIVNAVVAKQELLCGLNTVFPEHTTVLVLHHYSQSKPLRKENMFMRLEVIRCV